MQYNIALDVRWSYCSAIVLQEDLHCTVTGGGGYSVSKGEEEREKKSQHQEIVSSPSEASEC